jgi:hypothetical protein
MDLSSLLPDIKPWVRSLVTVWPAPIIKGSSWIFPTILCTHLLSLTVLGGATLLPNLRLMGVGLTKQSPAVVEKTMRPWLIGAIIVLAITGILMGMVNPMKLYTRPAFLVKMIAFIAALILSLGVVRAIASRDGVVTMPTKVLAGVALVVWLASVALFGTSYGVAPGMFHVISVAWLIVMVFGSKLTRIILGAITAVTVIGVGIFTYVMHTPLEDYDLVMETNRWTVRIAAVVVTGFILWEFGRTKQGEVPAPAFHRLVGVLAILAWFTVAAAGRWIGLGTAG